MTERTGLRPELKLRGALFLVGLVYLGLVRNPKFGYGPVGGIAVALLVYLAASKLLESDSRALNRYVLAITEAVLVSGVVILADGVAGPSFFLAPAACALASLEFGVTFGTVYALTVLGVLVGPALGAAKMAGLTFPQLALRAGMIFWASLFGILTQARRRMQAGDVERTQSMALERAQQAARQHSEARKQREQELFDERRKLEALMDVAHRLAVLRRPDELLFTIAACAKEQMQVEIAVVLLRRGADLVVEWSEGITSYTAECLRTPVGQGLLGRLAATGEPFAYSSNDGVDVLRPYAPLGGLERLIPGIAKRSAEDTGFQHRKLDDFRCFMVAPLKSPQDNQPIGLLLAANRLMHDRFSQYDVGYLQILATDAAISLRNLFFLSELERSHSEMIQALAQAIEAKDPYTQQHVARVRTYSVRLARAMGLPGRFIEDVDRAAMLHDVGKISTPDNVLMKQGPLNDEEFAVMKQHVTNSVRILRDIRSVSEDVQKMVLGHHERWDGKGYPQGLSGNDIPLGAQIISVADCYDAMTSDRPYRKGFEPKEALKRMESGAGSQFNAEILSYFFALFNYEPQTNEQLRGMVLQAKQRVGANLLRLPEPSQGAVPNLNYLDPRMAATAVMDNQAAPKRLELEA